ncbi:MAG: hypothetical protein AAB354_15085 [candidate division KSB1 bacterium]
MMTTQPLNLEQAWQQALAAFSKHIAGLTTQRLASLRIATLGPADTPSANTAAALLAAIAPRKNHLHECVLCPSYERAFASMLMGESDLLLVDNAYEGAHVFYRSPRACLLLSFMQDLPREAGKRKSPFVPRTSWSLFAPIKI